jgi:hypothetical protein
MSATTAAPHVFTVDVEDWYQGLTLDTREWPCFASRLETGLSRLLSLLPRAIDPAAGRYFSYPDADAIRRFRAGGRRFI